MAKIEGINIPKPEHLKNYIINGDMRISQRGTSFPAIGVNAYSLDRYIHNSNGAVAFTITQDTDVPTLAQAGYLFQNSLRMNVTTADASIAAGDYAPIRQYMEGYNFAALAQKDFTLSFWVKTTVPGVYCIAFRNNGGDRSYIVEYTVNSANTWEKKSVTVSASPAAGSWNYASSAGIRIEWFLAAGSTFYTTPNTWQTGLFFATANQVNGVGTIGNDFRITGVMLNEGNIAAPFRLFGEDSEGELAACQRYYQRLKTGSGDFFGIGVMENTTRLQPHVWLPVPLRTSPTVSLRPAATDFGIRVAGSSTALTTGALSIGGTEDLSHLKGEVNTGGAPSGAIAGGAGHLTNHTGSAYIDINAEL